MTNPSVILTTGNTHPACNREHVPLRANWNRDTPFDADAYVNKLLRARDRGKGTSRYVVLDNLFYEGPHEPSLMDDEQRGYLIWMKIVSHIVMRINNEIQPDIIILEDPKCGKQNRDVRDTRISRCISGGLLPKADTRHVLLTGFGIYDYEHLPLVMRCFGGPMAYRDLDNFEHNIGLAKAAQPHQRFIPWIPYVGFVNKKPEATYTFDKLAVTKMAVAARFAGARQVIAWYPSKRYPAQHWQWTMEALRDAEFDVPIDWDKVEVGA